MEEPQEVWMVPTIAEQARTVNQHQPAKHQGTWVAESSSKPHLGISLNRHFMRQNLAVGSEMGSGSSRNNQKCSWSQGEAGAAQPGISAISVHTSEIEKFTETKLQRSMSKQSCAWCISYLWRNQLLLLNSAYMWNNPSYFEWAVGWIEHKCN